MDLADFLNRPPERKRVLDGIANHEYEKHVQQKREFGDPSKVSRSEYRRIADRTLKKGDSAYAVRQGRGTNYLVGDQKAGTVAWINSKTPEKSTLFKPPDGVNRYIQQKLYGASAHKLDLDRVRKIQPTLSSQAPSKSIIEAKPSPPKPSLPGRAVNAKPRPPTARPASPPKPVSIRSASSAPKPPAPRPPSSRPTPPRPPAPGRPPTGPAGPRR